MNTAEPGIDGPSVKGSCFGVSFTPRTKAQHGTNSPIFHVWVEDDEVWHRSGDLAADVFWLDDLIKVLQAAQQRVKEAA